MSELDPVLQALAALPIATPPEVFSQKLRASAHARLVPTKLHPAWGTAVAVSVAAYLGWALFFTSQL